MRCDSIQMSGIQIIHSESKMVDVRAVRRERENIVT